jgi:hypothetical protein
MQFIFRNEPGDIYLAAVSKFILNAYDFGDAAAPNASPPPPLINGDGDTASSARERSNSSATPHNLPYLSELPYSFVWWIAHICRSRYV